MQSSQISKQVSRITNGSRNSATYSKSHKARSSITHQRKRKTNNRKKSSYHAHINDGVTVKARSDAYDNNRIADPCHRGGEPNEPVK